MNIIIYHTKIIIGVLFFISFSGNAQVELETVYLHGYYTEESVHTNNFSTLNDQLIKKDIVNFKTEIKTAKKDNSYLVFISEKNDLKHLTTNYLKAIRKGANKSSDYKTFKDFISEKFPELIIQFKKDNNLEDLYIISRKNTFNGKIAALPSVL